MTLLTGKQYRERNRERAKKWRQSLQEQGYKNFNIMLSPMVQDAINQKKSGTKLSNAEVIEIIIKENQMLKKTLKGGH
ncbi:MAG: hypothetical protein KAI40_11055 [Desulfobacterales bacterium]|nr:hypothetical protein [Desulfobacterales bacterium]